MPMTLPTLTLTPFNANVYSVHTAQGEHVGNLKRVGAVWKFKAIGQGYAGGLAAVARDFGVNLG